MQRVLLFRIKHNMVNKSLFFNIILFFFMLPFGVTASTYDVDGNGLEDALTDGLIVLRHEFGLAGEELTAGALASDATIINPETIANYIDQRL